MHPSKVWFSMGLVFEMNVRVRCLLIWSRGRGNKIHRWKVPIDCVLVFTKQQYSFSLEGAYDTRGCPINNDEEVIKWDLYPK